MENPIIESAVADAGLQAILDNLPGGVCVYERKGDGLKLAYMNDGAYALMGYTREEYAHLTEQNPFFIVHEDDAPALRETLRIMLDTGEKASCSYRITTKSGDTRYLSLRGRATKGQDGVERVSAVILDVTEQREAEDRLRIRDEEYRLVIAQGGRMVFRYDITGSYIELEQDVSELFGLPAKVDNVPESLITAGLIMPESLDDFKRFYFNIRRGEQRGAALIRSKTASGEARWFSAAFASIFSLTGEPVSAVISLEDVTRAREARIGDELERERLIVALENTYPLSLSVNLTKGTYKILYGRDNMNFDCEDTGLVDDLVRNAAKLMIPAHGTEFEARFLTKSLTERLISGSGQESMECLQMQRDGEYHWVEIRVFLISNRYGGDVMNITLMRMIDEQKRAEKTLREALEITSGELTKERLYQRQLDENIPAAVLILTPEERPRLMHLGGTLIGALGYSKEAFSALWPENLKSLIAPEDYEGARQTAVQAFKRRDESFEQEYRVTRRNGETAWLYEKSTLIVLEGGQHAYMSVLIDVTGIKELEERLRVGEEELALAMAQMGRSICLYDVKERTLTLSEGYAKKHGMPLILENMPYGMDELGILGDEETRARYIRFYQAIQRGDKTGSAECFLKCADGAWCWERLEFAAVFGSDGKPVKAIITAEDTTKRHQQDDENEALRRSEQMFRVVAKHSSRIIMRYQIATKTAYLDPATARQQGVPEVIAGLPESAIRSGLILPDSAGDYRRLFRDIHLGKPDGSAKIHMQPPKGKQRWMDMQYSLLYTDGDKPYIAVISEMDVTDIHEKELAYERYQQSIARVSDERSVIYVESDLTADEIERVGGSLMPIDFKSDNLTRSEMVDRLVSRYVAEEDRDACRAFFAREHLVTQFSDGQRSLQRDWRVNGWEGIDWMRSELQMIQDPYTGHIRIYTVLRDVTMEMNMALNVKMRAERDGMTGLYNRATTEALVKSRLQKRGGTPCAMLICDLDNLKTINDTMGHAQGDEAIRIMANTLKEHFRHTDVTGRIGGDEFLVYLEGPRNRERMQGMMTALMRRLADVRVGEKGEMQLKASIGVAMGTAGRETFGDLYQRADKALYHVKRNGKNDYAFYTEDMDMPGYQYVGHDEVSLWKTDYYDRGELTRLLYAVSSVYPLVISVNLTKNSYYMMEYDNYGTTVCDAAGRFDDLIEGGMATYHPDDRQSFYDAFSRENQLAAYARGVKRITHKGRQLGDDNVYRLIRTDVIFTSSDGAGDVMQISLGREAQNGD